MIGIHGVHLDVAEVQDLCGDQGVKARRGHVYARRLRQTRSWVVFFSILSRFGRRRRDAKISRTQLQDHRRFLGIAALLPERVRREVLG